MSGVYINIEMPKNGSCIQIVIDDDGKVYPSIEKCILKMGSIAKAVPVPPHGRLGDLDKLEQMFVDIDNAPYSAFDGGEPFYSAEDAAQIIRLAPTIIEAEEGNGDVE